MTIVLVIVVTIVIVVVVAYSAAWLGMNHRTRAQTMPIGWPLAASEEVVIDRPPAATRDLVLDVMAARGAKARLVTSSQVIFVPKLFPAGPLGTVVSVWLTPSVGLDAAETELLIEGQDVWQQLKGAQRTGEGGPPGARREVEAVIADLGAAVGGPPDADRE